MFGPLHVALYRWSLERGNLRLEEAAAELGVAGAEAGLALGDLLSARLLRQEQLTGEILPCTPDTAGAHLVGPIEAAIQRRRRAAREVEESLAVFRSAYQGAKAQRSNHEPLEYLRSLDAVRATLSGLTDNAALEIRAAHPVLPPQEAIEEGLERTVDCLRRGVRLRTLYPHSVLAHPYMRRHLERLTSEGAEFRTVSHVASRVIIFDRGTAVLPAEGPEPGALVLRAEPLLVYIQRNWDSAWETSLPFEPLPGQLGYGEADQELKRAIVRLLDGGLKDEVVARRLGISVRVCRRHIAEVMKDLGATSRFQAGSRAHEQGWLDRRDEVADAAS
ncbi:hypothetical protein ACWDYJ_19405 [Streptomyces sp. NPDC003042]